MKHHLLFFTLILLLTTSISKADDYVWGEEFEEGDIISAETFNQIFNTIEKINREVKDEDLIGTWSCNAITTRNTSGWTNKGAFYQLTNAQVTFTSSGSSSSIESPYSISTSAPSPFKRIPEAFTGVYSLFDNMIFTKISGETDSRIFLVDIKSETKIDFIFQETSAQSFPAQYSSYISCDSAVAVPAAPSATTATNAQTLVNVTWTDNSTDETGFKIYRRLSTETDATVLATAVTASPYADSTLTEGQTAYYSVAAYNDNGESAKTNVVSATLDSVKPTISSISPLNNSTTSSNNVTLIFSELVTTWPKEGTSGTFISYTKNGVSKVVNIAGVDILQSSLNFTFEYEASSTYTFTINRNYISDANGNYMSADYSFTFTTGS